MNKDELIVKQQLEIEELKITIKRDRAAIYEAYQSCIHTQQWSIKANEFPNISMDNAVFCARELYHHLPED